MCVFIPPGDILINVTCSFVYLNRQGACGPLSHQTPLLILVFFVVIVVINVILLGETKSTQLEFDNRCISINKQNSPVSWVTKSQNICHLLIWISSCHLTLAQGRTSRTAHTHWARAHLIIFAIQIFANLGRLYIPPKHCLRQSDCSFPSWI